MSSRKITIAKNVGFCPGVRRAIEIARQAAQEHGHVAMLGDIVHNEQVVEDLKNLGVVVYNNLDEIPARVPVILRSHGTKKEIREQIDRKELIVIDATCPLVEDIHVAARKLEAEGRHVIIIGDHGHDEVEAIASEVSEPLVLSNVEELKHLKKLKKAGIVIQSTQFSENVNEIITELIWQIEDLRIINTVCKPTRIRQSQIRELAENNDVMLIVGSFTSANTKRLTLIAASLNPLTYQVTKMEDIKDEWFKDALTVGIAAGASTPDEIVVKIAEKVGELPI